MLAVDSIFFLFTDMEVQKKLDARVSLLQFLHLCV